MKWKKIVSAALLFALSTSTLVGCGTSRNDSSGESSDKNKAGKEVTMWYYWENQEQRDGMDKVIEKYNKEQDRYEITAKYVPFADFKKQLSIGASASELPDIAVLDSPDHASYASMGIFADLTGKFDLSAYYDAPVNSCMLDNKLYGVPFGANCLALYYNEDMLAQAGLSVPSTWGELKTAAKALTTDKTTGLAFCSVQNEEGTFNFMPWLWSAGVTSYDIDSEEGIHALSYVKDLISEGVMSKECINWTQGDVMNQFISGNVAMMINGPWQIPSIEKEATDLNWKVALIPKDKEYASVIGGENYAVIKGGNEEGALDFLAYATQEDTVRELMTTVGYISANKKIAEVQYEKNSPYQIFVEELQYAQARGPLAKWPSVSDAISLAFNKVIIGEASPEDAAKEAQDVIDSIVQK